MRTTRLEAFSDGVIAILITIMVLDLKVPHGAGLAELRPLIPIFLAYILSFIYLAIYWSNHHHMLQVTEKVNGKVLWANNHLLFWLSLIPFATAWMGENNYQSLPTAIYGVVLLCSAIAYAVLQWAIVNMEKGENELLASAVRYDNKGKISIACYVVAIPAAFINQWISDALYTFVALMWLVPDRRIEEKVS